MRKNDGKNGFTFYLFENVVFFPFGQFAGSPQIAMAAGAVFFLCSFDFIGNREKCAIFENISVYCMHSDLFSWVIFFFASGGSSCEKNFEVV